MKDRKIRLAFFTVPEYDKEQEWLRCQHKDGWKLIHATLPGIYTFEKCKPEDVVYQLDYNQEGREEKSEYVQMFQDCGWEYITDMAGYSYFRKPVSQMSDDNEEEIFSDDASKLDMVERVFKGRMIPLFIIFFLIIIPNLFIQGHKDYIANDVLFFVFVLLFILYLVVFVKFGIQYMRLKKQLG